MSMRSIFASVPILSPPKTAAGDDTEDHDAWFKAEIARMQNEIGIRQLTLDTPGHAQVKGDTKNAQIVPSRYTPAGYSKLMELLGKCDIDFVKGVLAQIGIRLRRWRQSMRSRSTCSDAWSSCIVRKAGRARPLGG